MPIYEYGCRKCGKTTEVLQSVRDLPLTKCKCGGRLKKLISKNSFSLRGTGWYITDYGNKKPEKSLAPPKKESKDA